ncbi:hypothetical protein B0H19DRAFT_1249079 [Mycena capillaripes]|nr:hypothetical protein B0H19DRAFT_1249079 [Mycena capillaripes]
MSTVQKTNITAQGMIPDNQNVAHDARYWCLPPIRDTPSEGGGGNYPFYLVSQGHQVGVWHNWTVVKAMVDGYPAGAQRGHSTMKGCVDEWQLHCALGAHPHPVDPQISRAPAARSESRSPTKYSTATAPSQRANDAAAHSRGLGKGRPVEPELQKQLQKYCMPNLTKGMVPSTTASTLTSSLSSVSTCSSVSTVWEEVPPASRYFAIWNGRVVFTSRTEAKSAFLEAEAEGAQPRILSTWNYDEAQDYSEGVYWLSD